MILSKKNILLLGLFFLFPRAAFALDIPVVPDGYVTDHAHLLSPTAKQKLEQILSGFEAQSTNQIVVATFPSLEGEAVEDFSIRLAEQWKVGEKGKDNGVIFLIFKEDRQMRIEVGYGLESVLPDALAGQILDQEVRPYFQKLDYEAGIFAGVGAILRATQGEYSSAGPSTDTVAFEAEGRTMGKLLLGIIAIFFVIDYLRYRGYLYSRRLYKDRYAFWEWWFRFALLLFVLNLLFRILYYSMLASRGGYYGGRSGYGGFSSGGGSFGGGGASGRW
jgi:uncharacterized protein